MLPTSLEEYLFTIGMIVSFVGLILAVVSGRRDIAGIFRDLKINRKHIAVAVLIVILFVAMEIIIVQPAQLLFFDDDIYQSMAVTLLHTGQAWFCDYGSQTACYMGEILHEPIGEPFNLAISFAIFGVSRAVALNTGIVLSAIAVFAIFLVGFLFFKNATAALFSELLLALSPILLVWARPTTSDLPGLTYALVAVLFALMFLYRKNYKTLAMAAFSVALASYMKVDAIFMVVIVALIYIILDDRSIIGSIKSNLKRIKDNYLNTKALLVLLFFVIVIAPEFIYVYDQFVYGTYDYQGTTLQNSCNVTQYITVSGKYNVQNFDFNICSSVDFWFDQYSNIDIMQPVIFTFLALAGAATLLVDKRRVLLAIGIWFLAYFFIYAFFYAGSPTYGVNWRFQLSLVAQACLLGGYGCYALIELTDDATRGAWKKLKKKGIYLSPVIIPMVVLVFLIVYSFALHIPQLSISPANIIQAGNARFYENFVYNYSNLIPNKCAVFTYDPTLFIINNKTALQLSYIYNASEYANVSSEYPCLVVDYGYWCYTPDSFCSNLNQSFTLTNIVNETYQPDGEKFGFYYVTKKQ